MLDMHKKRGQILRLLDKVMPQNSSRILEHTDKHCNLSSFVLNRRPGVTVLCVEKFAQLAEASESPVALLGDKSMMGI